MVKNSIIQEIWNHPVTIVFSLLVLSVTLWQYGENIKSWIKDKFQEPTYIIVTEIDLPIMSEKYLEYPKFKGSYDWIGLLDRCGDLYVLHYELPSKPEILRKQMNILLNQGKGNLTYSVAIVTEKQMGIVNLYIHSKNVKTSIEKKVASVRVISEGNIDNRYDKNIEIVLSPYFDKVNGLYTQALFDIIPEQNVNLDLECFNTDDCQIIKTYLRMVRIPYGIAGMSNPKMMWYWDSEIKYPDRNFDKILIYEFNWNSAEFIIMGEGDHNQCT